MCCEAPLRLCVKFCSHSTPKSAPARAMASKLYDWDLRNIAKILKNYLLFEGTFIWSPSTPYKGLICAVSSESYDWDLSKSEGKILNPTPLPHMRLWFLRGK